MVAIMKFTFALGTIADILEVAALIPEFDGSITLDSTEARMQGKDHLILVARYDDIPIGFKAGYRLSDNQFYSWLGGVVPGHRKMKIASQLRLLQESRAIENGFKSIKVKSMNKFPSMLQMLIVSGYQVTGYENRGSSTNSKIEFTKYLECGGA